MGADKDWIYNGTITSVSYANLNPGNYIFQVRARRKGDNIWTEMEKPFSYHIKTPWNKSWWFITMLLTAAGFVIGFITRMYYLRKLERKEAVISQQRVLVNERNRIAADMHDDLGSGLTKIAYLSRMAIASTENKASLLNIQNTSAQLVENIGEIVWTLKEENNTLEDLATYIKAHTTEYCIVNNLSYYFQMPEAFAPQVIKGEIRRNIYLSVKEALHNIVKHAEAKNVSINIRITNNLEICIHDDGSGINMEKKQRLFSGNGLKNIKKRMEAIGGMIEIENNEGTTLRFRIPL